MATVELKSRIGENAGPFEEHATRESVEAFAQAIGAPVSDEAPPTYLTRFRHGEFELLNRLGFQLKNVLHGEQEYTFRKPIRAGDRVRFTTRIGNILEKRGMVFLVMETNFSVNDVSVATARSNIIHRETAAQK